MQLVEANAVTRNGKIEPGEREFTLDLLPVELESFDKVIGMDQLPSVRAEIDNRITMANEETTVAHEAGYAPTNY